MHSGWSIFHTSDTHIHFCWLLKWGKQNTLMSENIAHEHWHFVTYTTHVVLGILTWTDREGKQLERTIFPVILEHQKFLVTEVQLESLSILTIMWNLEVLWESSVSFSFASQTISQSAGRFPNGLYEHQEWQSCSESCARCSSSRSMFNSPAFFLAQWKKRG